MKVYFSGTVRYKDLHSGTEKTTTCQTSVHTMSSMPTEMEIRGRIKDVFDMNYDYGVIFISVESVQAHKLSD